MSSDSEAELKQTRAALQRHQKFLQAVRSSPLEFVDVAKLAKRRCPCCGARVTHISCYPFYDSPSFARQIVAWCKKCGFGMAPELSFSLKTYYEDAYAAQNRRDRAIEPETYYSQALAASPPPNLARYFNRSRDQLERIRTYQPRIEAILDVGSGPGYALFLSGAASKHALEYDKASKKYLDYIGAEIITWDTVPTDAYDVVLLSHVLEHFEPDDLEPRLSKLGEALKADGLLYIEVPPGGMGWKNYIYKHEPHTLFFTAQALKALCERLGFEVIFFGPVAKTLAKVEPRANPIYRPRRGPFANPRGRLTAICRKAPAPRLD